MIALPSSNVVQSRLPSSACVAASRGPCPSPVALVTVPFAAGLDDELDGLAATAAGLDDELDGLSAMAGPEDDAASIAAASDESAAGPRAGAAYPMIDGTRASRA